MAEDGSSVLFTMTIIPLGISFLAVVLRFIARGVIKKKIGWDDWLIAFAWVLSFGVAFGICLGVNYGLGREIIGGAMHTVMERKTRFVYTLLYHPALMATKTSILLFYLSISQNFKLVRWGNWATLFVVNVAGVVLAFLVAFQCKPLSATFQEVMPAGTQCIGTYALIYTSAPVNVITDLAILILPMPVLTSLRLPSKQKLILIMVFAGGGFTSIIGIIRIYYFEKALSGQTFDDPLSQDQLTHTWDGALSFVWSSVEINAGILCASIPMIKPLIAKFSPGCIGLRSSGSEDTGTSQDSAEFITFESPKSAISLSLKESLKPICLVTVLFLLWGFAYGFVSTCNERFEDLLGISVGESLGLHAAYFSGYLVAPQLFSGFLLKRYGFKVTFIVGLAINGCGCLIFWPSAVLRSYAGFCFSMVVVGLGLATLEVAANAFIILCGPQRHSEIRLNLSQAFQAVGALIGPIVAEKVLPTFVVGETSLGNVQWVYLGNAFFVFLLAIAFYYSKIPEVKDTDFPTGPERHASKSLWKGKYRVGMAWGVLGQCLYCGVQEIIWRFSTLYFSVGESRPQSHKSLNQRRALFIAGRFAAPFLMLFLRPRWILLGTLLGCTICSAFVMTTTNKQVGLTMIRLIFFFEAPVFPTIFASSLRGLGRHSKDAAKFQVSAAVGAAIFPPVYYSVYRATNARKAMGVTLALLCVAVTYPLYLCLSPRERKRLDQDGCSRATDVEDRPISIALQDKKPGRREYVEVL